MNKAKILRELKETTFNDNYRMEDWLLTKLMEIEREHERDCLLHSA